MCATPEERRLAFIDGVDDLQQELLAECQHLGVPIHVMEDLIQDVLLALWNLPAFDPCHPGRLGFARQRLIWRYHDCLHGQPPEVPLLSGPDNEGGQNQGGVLSLPDPEAEEPWFLAALGEAHEQVRAAVGQLDELDQMIVAARAAGMTFADIGHLVGLSVAGVYGRWGTALQTLHTILHTDPLPE
jgi:DNA-directed RNA polymerase specialized sigma24 family protein